MAKTSRIEVRVAPKQIEIQQKSMSLWDFPWFDQLRQGRTAVASRPRTSAVALGAPPRRTTWGTTPLPVSNEQVKEGIFVLAIYTMLSLLSNYHIHSYSIIVDW